MADEYYTTSIIKIYNVTYKYEFFWRDKKGQKVYDSEDKILPFPKHYDQNGWPQKEQFLDKLQDLQQKLSDNHKIISYEHHKNCLLCDKKNITNKLFTVNGIRWEDGMTHYIDTHNIKPSNSFIDFIFRSTYKQHKPQIVARIKGVNIVKSDKKFLKIDRNQLLIMDALMRHGGYKIYKDKNNKDVFRYSEHAGLLDFDNSGLEKIIISGNTTRVDENDDDIFLPKNMKDAYDYEYIFHTHPPTPKPGARVKSGVLFEFPSISDMFHFMDHYNDGKTQGSIIIAPEGLYIIRKKEIDDKKITINEDKFFNETNKILWKCQNESIKKYGKKFTQNDFYSKISQDKTYIDTINNTINKYNLHIDYFSRIRDSKNRWIIDTIYLPVFVIESEK